MPTATVKELNTVALSSRKCGFCNTGSHDRCPGGTRSGAVGVRICPCEKGERCGKPRCLKCNNRKPEELDLNDWTCTSTTQCEMRIAERLAADPLHQQINQAKEKAKMAEATETKAKREKVEKTGTCLVTGKPTKGGLFAPGQDAKYVSLRVEEAAKANFTQAALKAGLKRMKEDGTSEKLQAKFEKAFGLAKERAEKAKEAEREKAAAKKTAASKPQKTAASKRAASKAAEPVEDEDGDDDEE